MRKNITVLLLFIIAISLMITLFIRTVDVSKRYVDIQDIELLNLQKNELAIANNRIKEQINEVDAQIEAYLVAPNKEELMDQLQRDIAHYKNLVGRTTLRGEGVVITVSDSKLPLNPYQTPEDVVIHDANLRLLIDELWQAGAEAISINGMRIVFGLSEIHCSGPTININGVEHGEPYIIRAIGDRYALQRAMVEDGSYANTLERFSLNIEVNTRVDMTIDGYKDHIVFKYAKVEKQ